MDGRCLPRDGEGFPMSPRTRYRLDLLGACLLIALALAAALFG